MKTILITGAAQGIGLATAKRYAAQGWFVGMYDLNREALTALLESGQFPNACGDYCDVTNVESLHTMFEHFSAQANGQLDLFVNNAGVLSAGRFEEISFESHAQMVNVNITGATNALQLAFPLLKQTPGATVVNLCSASSIHGIPKLAVYSASKFYVNGITEALDLEWREFDIRVTSVKPPVINNPMGRVVADELPQKLGLTLNSDDVAEHIQRAAEGRGNSFPMGGTTQTWYWIDKLLPNKPRSWLTNFLTGQ